MPPLISRLYSETNIRTLGPHPPRSAEAPTTILERMPASAQCLHLASHFSPKSLHSCLWTRNFGTRHSFGGHQTQEISSKRSRLLTKQAQAVALLPSALINPLSTACGGRMTRAGICNYPARRLTDLVIHSCFIPFLHFLATFKLPSSPIILPDDGF
jgi:hypothetical protein